MKALLLLLLNVIKISHCNLQKDSKSEDGYLEGADELADMQPDDEDGDYYRVVYEDKTAPNFRHDENILSDPKRGKLISLKCY